MIAVVFVMEMNALLRLNRLHHIAIFVTQLPGQVVWV